MNGRPRDRQFDESLAVKLFCEGLSPNEVGLRLNQWGNTIRSLLKRKGVYVRRKLVHSVETRNLIAEANCGRKLSAEIRQKISQSGRGRVQTVDWVNKRIRSGWTHSEESKLKMSFVGRKNKGRKQSADWVKKRVTAGWLGKHHSSETIKKLSAFHSSPEMKKAHRERLLLTLKRCAEGRLTNIERVVKTQLDDLKLAYEYQFRLGDYLYDFFLFESGLLIECDGAYWHSSLVAKERDLKKERFARSIGYKVVRLSEDQILKNDFNVGEFV